MVPGHMAVSGSWAWCPHCVITSTSPLPSVGPARVIVISCNSQVLAAESDGCLGHYDFFVTFLSGEKIFSRDFNAPPSLWLSNY